MESGSGVHSKPVGAGRPRDTIFRALLRLTHRDLFTALIRSSSKPVLIQLPFRTFTCSMPSKKDDKYTDPELREEVKEEITAGEKGGAPGQWSARKVR